jgi:hypothetical protein
VSKLTINAHASLRALALVRCPPRIGPSPSHRLHVECIATISANSIAAWWKKASLDPLDERRGLFRDPDQQPFRRLDGALYHSGLRRRRDACSTALVRPGRPRKVSLQATLFARPGHCTCSASTQYRG